MASQAQFNTTAPSGSDQHWKVAVQTGAPVLILSASQEQRVHASIFNDSPGTLYITFGSNNVQASSSAQWDVRLSSGSYYELPKPIWQGEVWGIWDSNPSPGAARVLQLGRDDK